MEKQRISPSRKKKLRRLANLMNQMHKMPVPAAGVIIEIMDFCIGPEEADYLLKMGTGQYTYEQASALSGLPEEQFHDFFERMLHKGFVWPSFESTEQRFEIAPVVPGWLEMQLVRGGEGPYEKEFARKTEDLLKSLGKLNVFPLRPLGNLLVKNMLEPFQTMGTVRKALEPAKSKRIPVNRNVEPRPSDIMPTHDVSEIIDMAGADNAIALVHCFCRHWRKLVDDPCRFDIPPESCLVVGPFAKHAAQYDFARLISKKEAFQVMEDVSKAGAVHTLFHEKDDTGRQHLAICNCCWDCCGLLGGFNRGCVPLYFKCNYEARIPDEEKCVGCEVCAKHCPTRAITLKEKKAKVEAARCIGCGQCVLQFPTDTLELVPNQRDVLVPLEKPSRARLR